MSVNSDQTTVILGAGLSGLACALTLHRAAQKVLVIDQNPHVGGRVSSLRSADGFLFDQGFQVLLNSYPEVQKFVSLDTLNLRPFNSGALIFDGKNLRKLANPLRHPMEIFSTLSFPAVSLRDKGKVMALIAKAAVAQTKIATGKTSTESFLKDFGFSKEFIEVFWRPFFTGVYLDPELNTGSDFFLFLLKCFGLGQVSLPAAGMNAFPTAMAKQLPDGSVRLNTRVKSWTKNQVVLDSNEQISARQVICALDPEEGKARISKANYRGVSTYYFTGERLKEVSWGKWLVLVPNRLGLHLNHLAMLSDIAPEYSSSGKPLLSVTVVGHESVGIDTINRDIDQIAGRELSLKLVAATRVQKALPVSGGEESGFLTQDDVIYCGDRWASPSINGALQSGRLAAEYYLRGLKPIL